jgi:citrate:succinate antiporter/L-tartrate/succinate antiporter
VWLLIVLLPRPAGLDRNAWGYLGLFSAVIVALVLEPIPPAGVGLLGVTLATVLGHVAASPADAIKWGLSGFSDATVWLIFGALVLSTGYEKTGLGRRIALSLVKVMGRSALGLGYAVVLADLVLAPFTPSNTGRSAGVIYPIIRGIPPLYGSAPGPTARRLGAYLMWTAFAATAVTSSMFVTALAPNLLAIGLVRQATGLEVSWSQWFLGFLPVGAPLLATLPLVVYLVYPPEIRSSPEVSAWAAIELGLLGRLTIKEAVMACLIVLALALWVLGGKWIHATTTILVVVSLLVLLGLVRWDDLVENRTAWDAVIYFATLLTLADGLNRVGIVAWAAHGISRQLSGASSSLFALVVLVSFFFVVHYAFASLTAHTIVVLPALIAAGASLPGMPVKVLALALSYSIGLMGVISPYATGPAPVYFGSGFIARKDFWMLGFVFGLVYLVTLLAIGVPFLLWRAL